MMPEHARRWGTLTAMDRRPPLPPHAPPHPSRRAAWRHAAGWLLLAQAGIARAGLPELVARVRQSVFPVGVFDPLASPRFQFRGTGFVVGDGRLLATSAHVLPEDAAQMPRLAMLVPNPRQPGDAATGSTRALAVQAIDRLRDVALLRIDGPPLPVLALAEAPAREGQSIALVGYPMGGSLGFAPVTHRGIVASIVPVALPGPTASQLDAAAVARLRQGPLDVYQLDATAFPGNSGGPLLDEASGQVLGLVNMVLANGSRESLLRTPLGVSFAVPVEHLRALLNRP